MTQLKDFIIQKWLWDEYLEYKRENHNNYFKAYRLKLWMKPQERTWIIAKDKVSYQKEYFQKVIKLKRQKKRQQTD